ncbi:MULTISPECIES: dienelactone hydrolase family protein [unclassified Micromonospora]|uniref:dienelactone hydrolase family protein n=1 Tax=unclassified Micromonospora TaxID=2617518 RepID=UPI003A87F319
MSPNETPGWVTFPSGTDQIQGYLALPEPRADRLPPVVLMAHENLGVTEHRQDVTRRYAAQGFACLTVNMFSRVGGRPPQDYTTVEERRAKAFLAATDEQAVPDFEAALDYLAGRGDVDTSRAAAVGFCLGGGTVLVWATRTDRLRCVVPLYGLPVLPPEYSPTGRPRSRIEAAESVRCPVQAHYGEADQFIPLDEVRQLKQALARSGQSTELHLHPDAGHAYHDDTHPNYHSKAAQETDRLTFDFLHAYLDR